MVSRSHYEWDARVRREARALSEAGHDVTFMGLPSTISRDSRIRLINVGSAGPANASGSKANSGRTYRAARWLLLPEYRELAERRFQRAVADTMGELAFVPDVVHAHDYPALLPSLELANRFGSRLIYDSHEIWAERPRRGRPEPMRRRLKRKRESSMAALADAVIMVSERGADYLRESLGIDRVHVIRNTFPIDTAASPPSRPLGGVYAGRIAPMRDLATVFAASVWQDGPLELHLMGEIDEIEPPPWVTVHAMGTVEEVNDLLALVGIGLVTMTDRYVNHRIALPNKLFQSISAGIPVVATDVPQTADVVRTFDLGELYTPGDAGSFDNAMRQVVSRYEELVNNVAIARPAFDWSIDAKRLVALYRDLDNTPSDFSNVADDT